MWFSTLGSGANTMRTFLTIPIASVTSNISYAFTIGDEAQEIMNSGAILFSNSSNNPELLGTTEVEVLFNQKKFICLVKEFQNLVLCLELEKLDTLYK